MMFRELQQWFDVVVTPIEFDALRRFGGTLQVMRVEVAPQFARKGRIQTGADADITVFDPGQILETREVIRSFGSSHTVLLSTHILQEVDAMASRVVMINEGRKVYDGSVEGLGNRGELDEAFSLFSKIFVVRRSRARRARGRSGSSGRSSGRR